MAEKYYSILTNKGKELEAQSSATGKPVIIKDFVVGDGNGQAVRPDPAQTKLVREVYRNAISALQVSPDQANQFIAQLVLPVDVGGFVVREVGLLTDAGELYSVANCAAIEKPENGVSVSLQYRLAVSETANVELKVATGDGLFLRIDKNLSEIAAKGEAAQKSSREAIGVLDATIGRKGLVQLSSATDSTSEAIAATPKAIKTVNDDLTKVKESLGTAAKADVVTSMTDTTTGRVPVTGWHGLGGVAPRTPAVASNNYDNIPTDLPSGFWTHAVSGGPYAYTFTLYQDGGAVKQSRHLIIPSDPKGKIAFRWDGATGTGSKDYQYFYTDKNKPSAADVDAVSSSQGGTFQKGIAVKGNGAAVALWPLAAGQSTYLLGKDYNGDNVFYVGRGGANYHVSLFNYKGGTGLVLGEDGSISVTTANGRAVNLSGPMKATGEMQSSSANSFRIAYGSYGTFWRNDGNRLYLMMTNSGDQFGGYNNLRPFYVDISTGAVTMGHGLAVNGGITGSGRFVPSDYGNFDSRYYTKAQSDAGYMAKTGAYTKAESDGRYPLKTATVIDVRQGSPGTIVLKRNGWNYVPGGCAFTGWYVEGDAPVDDTIQYKPIQININGAWRTISG
jgi:hypothetical protein